jgi:tetratricopeptide (TPR) repeat protein
VAAGLFVYGLAFPLTLRLNWAPARWLDRVGIAPPPLYLWPFFVTAAWLELSPLNFNETEVAEVLVPLALALMAAQYGFAQRRGLAVHALGSAPGASWRFSLNIFAIVAVISLAAAATTSALLGIPAQRERIEGRLWNGYEKFAGRYERYDRWDVAAGLWLRLHEEEPDRTFVLRRLATAYRELGDRARFELYTRKALDIALVEYAQDPDDISVNLSLSRTYRQLGDEQKYREHSQRAFQLARERAEAEPESSHWAYWVAKTARNMGNYQVALEQYRRA